MTLILDLPPGLEAALAHAAAESGTTPESLAVNELGRRFPSALLNEPQSRTISPEVRHRRVHEFLQWATEQDRNTPNLTDEEISREAIYPREDDTA